MAEDTARQITGSYQDWTSFLRTAARLYKYPYHEQLMIYAQRPDATTCASFDLWNNTMRRYVRRGSKGIALVDTSTDMSFDEQGLVIGKTGNPFTFRVVNDRLAFFMNDTEVAYLSNNKLYVTQAEILTKLIIGKFAFEPQANGNLSLIYNG